MTESWAAMVATFNKANGYRPLVFPSANVEISVKILRLRLMMEELGELSCAMHENNLVEIADGLTDLLYVVVGTAVDYGLGPILEELFQEVQRSNMTKTFITTPDGRKGGIKGPGFSPPDIKGVIDGFVERYWNTTPESKKEKVDG